MVAVNELNVTIRKGEVFGVLGPNGSGKTTTLGMILGVTHPKSGSFEWFQGKHGKNTRKKVGAIIESPIFYPYMTALDNLKIVAKIKKQDYSDIERVLKLVELWDRRKSAFKTFSLGMKQRLAIAAALVGNPDALILDEPTNGLDPQGIAEIRNLIKKISGEGVTIILASHLLDEVQKVCTHVMIMQKGNKLAAGRVDEILSDKHLLEVKAEDMGVLIQALADVSMVEAIKEDRDKLIIEIKAESNADELNKILAHKGVFLSHLLAKEKSLEKFFLEITNKNHV
nr:MULTISPECIES: ATP-binding cassette domain-containing protein [unclassified Lentimicrobium]